LSKPIAFDSDLAVKYGVEEAILIRSFQYWIELNKVQGRNMREERTWTYNTYEELAEQYPFWNAGKLRRLIDSLISQNVLVKTNKFNKWAIDKTNWYAFQNESEFLKVKTVPNNRLPESTDAEGLFDQTELKAVNDAVGDESASKLRLTKKTDGKVSDANLDENTTDEKDRRLMNLTDDLPESTDLDLPKTADVHLSNSTDQYQLLNNSLITDDKEKKDLPVVSTYELLFNKKPLQAFYDGTCDKLAFDFYNIDLVNSNIERLFRMFVKDSQPIQIHVDRVRNELLNDPRPELPRKVCWVIIQMKFMQFPGTNKKYQDFESLMKRIRWDKDEFVQQLPQANKFNEARLDRQKEKESDEQQRQEANVTALEWIEQKLLKYKNVLTAKEINEINKMVSENKIQSAKGKLEGILYDDHNIKEVA
jgi:hypothetical protein